MAIVADTSGLFALADADSRAHAAVRSYLESNTEPVVVPITVLPELDYLLASRLGLREELAVLRAAAAGEFRVEPVSTADLTRAIALIEAHADAEIGLVDASLVAVAERLRIFTVLTLDRRHFAALRPRHCEAFTIVP